MALCFGSSRSLHHYSPRGALQFQKGDLERALLCFTVRHRQLDRHHSIPLRLFDVVRAHHVLGDRESVPRQ